MAAASNITGFVSEMSEGGKLNRLYTTGIPMAMASAKPGIPLAAIWGNSDSFSAKQGEYSVCSWTTMFWLVLSDPVEIRRIAAAQKAPLKQLDAVSAIASGGKGLLFAAGKAKGNEGICGIYYVQGEQELKKLLFSTSGIDTSITALAATHRSLFFADTKGNVSRVGPITSK